MSAKITAARRAAFLKALEQTGNVTLSAERAKVSRSWVRLHRKGDPAFDEACRAALAAAKASFDRLRASDEGGRKPPSGWGHLDGVELVVKGSGGSALRDAAGAAPQDERKKGRRVQIARARLRQWTPRVEERFLATLAATCNVRAACAEVGMWPPSAYNHRKRWPAFAKRWDAAVEQGYCGLEMALIETGGNLFSAPELPADAPIREMNAAQAIHLLHMHKRQVKGIGGRPGLPERQPTWEEVGAYFTRALAATKRAERVSEGRKRRDRRERARRRSG